MHFEILTAFAICAAVYVLSRVVSWIVEEKEAKVKAVQEEERLERVASLYGRTTRSGNK
tara:strand:- start:5624 stop:5800 length:177 start_codon:yes stop_codon:yes gene_type:complete